MVARAYLGLGSNLGDRAALIGEALAGLRAWPAIRVANASSLYETAPWGDPDQPDYLNAAVEIETVLSPLALLDACQEIERDLERVRGRRWGPRTIDIDILDYDGVARADERLTLPHPRLCERAFVLVPLAEIAPDLVLGHHPITEWLARVDASRVMPVSGGLR